MFCSYNLAKSNISSDLGIVGRSLDSYLSSYDKFLVIVDLDSEISKMAMSEFCEKYNHQNLVKDPICYKNPSKPTCVDPILTNFIPAHSKLIRLINLGKCVFKTVNVSL